MNCDFHKDYLVEFTSEGGVGPTQVLIYATSQEDAIATALRNYKSQMPLDWIENNPSYAGWKRLVISVSEPMDEDDEEE